MTFSTEDEEEKQIEHIADSIFDALPGDGQILHLIPALVVVAGFTLCNFSGDKKQALENAKIFHVALRKFIDEEFDVATDGRLDS